MMVVSCSTKRTRKKSSVQVVIRPAGIQTSSKALNKELQGSNWFNAKHPEMKFTSTSVKLTGEKTADITGDLTLLGVTKAGYPKSAF